MYKNNIYWLFCGLSFEINNIGSNVFVFTMKRKQLR